MGTARPRNSTERETTEAVRHANRSVRRGSVVAGVGLLLMVVFAVVGNFVAIEGLVTYGDAAQTATDVTNAEGTFRIGIASLVLVAVLDVLVAWGLFRVFEPANRSLSLLAAWLRIVYAGVFVVAVSHLVGAVTLLTGADSFTPLSTEQTQVLALAEIHSFADIWSAGLILFGFHLVVLGALAYRSTYAPRVLGALLVIAGVGYLVDSFGAILSASYSLELSLFTFVGEVVLIGWLLLRGRRLDMSSDAASN